MICARREYEHVVLQTKTHTPINWDKLQNKNESESEVGYSGPDRGMKNKIGDNWGNNKALNHSSDTEYEKLEYCVK